MNIHKLDSSIQCLGSSGHIISHEQNVLLYHSLTCLQNDNHFQQVFYWGQIWGVEKDYYIAYGYVKDALRGRIFFYSTDCINWGLLPRSTPELCTLMLSNPALFQGDPALLVNLNDQPASVKNDTEGGGDPEAEGKNPEAEGKNPEAEEKNPEPPGDDPVVPSEDKKDEGGDLGAAGDAPTADPDPDATPAPDPFADHVKTITDGELKEENRLAAVVDMINEECAIVPRLALLKRQDDVIVENAQFTGLTYAESLALNNYFHFRNPLFKWNTNLLANPAKNYNYAVDFLDNMDKDIPEGRCWSRQYMMGSSVILFRNLFWPGSIFYHRINTPDCGNMYVGWGRREIDFPFMFS